MSVCSLRRTGEPGTKIGRRLTGTLESTNSKDPVERSKLTSIILLMGSRYSANRRGYRTKPSLLVTASTFLSYAVVILMASFLGSCHRQTESRLGSFSVTDPSIANQLISGFYTNESGFRWAGPTFTFAVPIPKLDHELTTATFTLSLYVTPNEIEQLGPVTITATGPEAQFAKATYDKSGAYDLVVKFPRSAICCTNLLPLTFSVDKYMRGSNGDRRDLAVVVTRFKFQI